MIKIILNAFLNVISDYKTDENKSWLKSFVIFGLIGFSGLHRFLNGKIKGGFILLIVFLLFIVAHLFEGINGFKNMTMFFLGLLMLVDYLSLVRGKLVVDDKLLVNNFPNEIITIFTVLVLVYLLILYLL